MFKPPQRGSRFRTRTYLQAVADAQRAEETAHDPQRDNAHGDHRLHISAALAALGPRRRPSPPTVEPPPRFYRTTEIAAYFGLSRQTIHNYTTMGLITEEDRTEGNHRLYDESVFSALVRIQRLKATHRLQDIRRVFEDEDRRRGSSPPAQPTHSPSTDSGR